MSQCAIHRLRDGGELVCRAQADLGKPGVASGDGHDPGLGDRRDGVDAEAVEGLAGRQAGLVQMTLDAPPVAFGRFVPGDGGRA